jgi:hypothetical protein
MTSKDHNNKIPITPEATLLDIVFHHRKTEDVFNRYGDMVGVCLCCEALFESLEAIAEKYDLDLHQLTADLREAAETRQV